VSNKGAAQKLAEEIIRPLNDGTIRPESTMSLNQFIEDCYLPYVEQERRRSTYCGYRNIWLRYVQPEGEATTLTQIFAGASMHGKVVTKPSGA